MTCKQSAGFFGLGLGVGVVLALGDGLCEDVGLGDGAGVVLAAVLALGVAVDVADGLADDDGLCAMNAAKVTAIGCPWRASALTVAAGRLAHVVAALRATSRFA